MKMQLFSILQISFLFRPCRLIKYRYKDLQIQFPLQAHIIACATEAQKEVFSDFLNNAFT